MSELKAVLFDLDGTLLDNNQFHYEAWKRYLKKYDGKDMSDEDFKDNLSGRTNQDAIEHLYNKKMSEEEAAKYYLKKEEIYRELYAPHIAPINGLIDFLKDLDEHEISMAIATSGIPVNIEFMFKHVPIKQYFREIIKAEDISKGKPDPEIFLKTAEVLQIPVGNCVVFEDSTSGVEAGKAAGMKVVALTTTHSPEELNKADLVIKDYTELNYEKLCSIL